MLVGVNEVAGFDDDARDGDGLTEVDEMDIGMTDAGVEAEHGEAQSADFVEVAGAAGGDVADAAESVVDGGVDFTELSTQAWRVVEILADGDFGSLNGGDIAEIFGGEIAAGGGASGVSPGSHGVADDGTIAGNEAADGVGEESAVAGADIEELDGVGDGRCGEAFQLFEQFQGDGQSRLLPCVGEWRNRCKGLRSPLEKRRRISARLGRERVPCQRSDG